MPKKLQVANLLKFLEGFAPPSLAEAWDNVGLQVGSLDDTVSGILVSLDVTEAVLWEAVEHGANCLVTHHPLFFQAFTCLHDGQVSTRLGRLATQMGVNILSFHTNLDSTTKGLNNQLAKTLGLKGAKSLFPSGDKKYPKAGLGRLGSCTPTNLKNYLKHCSKKLKLPHLRYVGDPKHAIKKVAVMTGSGGAYFNEAKAAGAHVLVTGDVKYHHALDALAQGIAMIDIGHFGGERLMIPLVAEELKAWLKGKAGRIKVWETQVQEDPFQFWSSNRPT